MKAVFSLLFGVFMIGTALAQEPILQNGQSFLIKIAGVPADDVASVGGGYTISDSGTISLLYLPEIKASGLRPSELARKIESAYRSAQIYSKPNITVSVGVGGQERYVSVLGEVNARRQVPHTPGLTMLDAIAQCGGFSDFGDPKRVKLTRAGKASYHDLSRTTSSDNATLQPNDIITVPKPQRLLRSVFGTEE